MTIYSVYKENHPVTPKEVVNVVDLGYLGIEKDYPEQLSSHYHVKSDTRNMNHKKKKSISEFIQKRG